MASSRIIKFIFLIAVLVTSIPMAKAMDPHKAKKLADYLDNQGSQLLLQTLGDSRDVSSLEDIKEADIKNVTRNSNDKVESYSTILPGGDALICSFKDNSISCIRTICCDHIFRDISVISRYFYILKKIAEQEKLTTQ